MSRRRPDFEKAKAGAERAQPESVARCKRVQKRWLSGAVKNQLLSSFVCIPKLPILSQNIDKSVFGILSYAILLIPLAGKEDHRPIPSILDEKRGRCLLKGVDIS